MTPREKRISELMEIKTLSGSFLNAGVVMDIALVNLKWELIHAFAIDTLVERLERKLNGKNKTKS